MSTRLHRKRPAAGGRTPQRVVVVEVRLSPLRLHRGLAGLVRRRCRIRGRRHVGENGVNSGHRERGLTIWSCMTMSPRRSFSIPDPCPPAEQYWGSRADRREVREMTRRQTSLMVSWRIRVICSTFFQTMAWPVPTVSGRPAHSATPARTASAGSARTHAKLVH